MLIKNKWKSAYFAFQIFIIYYWLSFFLNADSYYAAYLLTGIAGILCCGINWKEQNIPEGKREKILTLLFALVLSTTVVAANYAMFVKSESLWWSKILSFFGTYLGGIFSFGNILVCLAAHLRNFSFEGSDRRRDFSPVTIFLLAAIPMIILNILILFLCEYPGNLTSDSIDQIKQLFSGDYSNHHPFYHTMIIGFFAKIGYAVWGNLSAGIAVYNVCQILFMAGCFGFSMATLYQAGIPVKYIVACDLFYTLMPFHIMYSITVWKDIIFSGIVLLITVFVFRVLANIGSHRALNCFMCLLGGLGLCLLRSNGWFAYLLITVSFLLLFGKKHKKLCFSFLFVLVISFILKHSVLAALNVTQPDTIESLSIPAQQIARVVTEYDDLTEAQRALLSEVVEVDKISTEYAAFASDPIKELVRRKNNQDYLVEHKGEFLKLYIELGFAHPAKYVEAWIDQTRGFWNGGYSIWRWDREIAKNDFGISKEVKSERARQWLDRYLELFSSSNSLIIFLCIGFYVWIIVIVCYISLIRRDRVACFLTFPVFAVVFTLLVATPVFAEFRYAYAVFCTIPFLLFAPFTGRPDVNKNESVVNRKN